jgi:hypothetical protein
VSSVKKYRRRVYVISAQAGIQQWAGVAGHLPCINRAHCEGAQASAAIPQHRIELP